MKNIEVEILKEFRDADDFTLVHKEGEIKAFDEGRVKKLIGLGLVKKTESDPEPVNLVELLGGVHTKDSIVTALASLGVVIPKNTGEAKVADRVKSLSEEDLVKLKDTLIVG